MFSRVIPIALRKVPNLFNYPNTDLKKENNNLTGSTGPFQRESFADIIRKNGNDPVRKYIDEAPPILG